VPYSYSPSPDSTWTSVPGGMQVQAMPQGTDIPEGNNTPTVTAISGSNPYTITFTNTAGCPTSSHTGVVIQLGIDCGVIVAGNSAGDTGTVVMNNVFDGSDTAEAQWNPPVSDPAYDCTSNNQACMASVMVGNQGPQIWRNNVMRYVSNGFIGSSTEMSGNLLEYFRLGLNPTGHTNAWEDQPCLGTSCFYYNNVIRHMNWISATGIPGGAGQIGVPLSISLSSTSATAYVFNNVIYDMTQNIVIETNTISATFDLWNNTIQGGPDAGAAYETFTCNMKTCIVENNHAITTNTSPFGACGSGCTETTNLTQTPVQATGSAYISGQTYAFVPNSGTSATAGTGTNAESLCATLASINPTAGTACQYGTSFSVLYCQSNHTVTVPVIAPSAKNKRPASGGGNWNIGGYEYGTGIGAPPPCIASAALVVE
jgi:hypothetical protein